MKVGSAKSFTIGPSSCKIGRSKVTCRKEVPELGDSMPRLRAAVSPATCWRTASTPRFGSTARSPIVCAMTETFVKERMHALTGKVEKVGIDDACTFMGHFENGSLANFESTRYARGHKAAYTFEINGEDMSIYWDLHDLHRLQVFDYKDDSKIRGWKSIHVTDNSPDHPYMDKWWVPGLSIGYDASFTHQVADFLHSLESGESVHPSFRDALETQRVLDAVLQSAKDHQWTNVK